MPHTFCILGHSITLVSTQVYIYEEEDEEPEEGLGEQQADMSGHPCAYIKTCIFYIENVYKVLEGNPRAYITKLFFMWTVNTKLLHI